MSDRPVMIVAGGTGGHVFPALAVAAVLARRAVPVVWLGTRAGLEARVVPATGFAIDWLEVSGLRGRGFMGWLRAPLRLLRALVQARRILRRRQPRSVLGMGGYVTGPAGLAARWLGLPLVVHEQNAVPGLTNRLLAPLATRVLTGFDVPLGRRPERVGNPVRAEIVAIAREAREVCGEGRPRVLVLGGSLGARALNETVPAALAALPTECRPEVFHQTGERTREVARDAYRRHAVEARVASFIEDMAAAYEWADLVICRAGALTVAELAAVGRAAVLVPFPHAVDDHQTANAAFLVNADAARLLPESRLDATSLASLLGELLGDRNRLRAMGARARALGRPEAAERVADVCLEVAHG